MHRNLRYGYDAVQSCILKRRIFIKKILCCLLYLCCLILDARIRTFVARQEFERQEPIDSFSERLNGDHWQVRDGQESLKDKVKLFNRLEQVTVLLTVTFFPVVFKHLLKHLSCWLRMCRLYTGVNPAISSLYNHLVVIYCPTLG